MGSKNYLFCTSQEKNVILVDLARIIYDKNSMKIGQRYFLTCILEARACAEKPAKTTECMAPILAHANIVATVIGHTGM